MNRILITIALMVTFYSGTLMAAPFQVPPVLKRFVSEDVVGVGFVDLNKVNASSAAAWINSLGFTDKVQQSELLLGSKKVQQSIDKMKESGASKLYFILRISDFENAGPSWVMSVEEGHDSSKLLTEVKPVAEQIKSPWEVNAFEYNSSGTSQVVEAFDGFIIGANNASQLSKLKSSEPLERAKLDAAWKQVESEDAGLVFLFFNDQDSRKVVRQLLPNFSVPFKDITGGLVADETEWLAMGMKLPPKAGGSLKLVCSNEKAAGVYLKAIGPAIELMKQQTSESSWSSAVTSLIENVKPKQNGNEVVVNLDSFFSKTVNVASVLKPAFDAARRTERLKKVRNLTLAMHNYESAWKAFPTHASYSAEGKPLLSWRVTLLPFLGQNLLFEQFKHDEPWDSKHNIKLVKKMPDIFADPDPKFAQLARDGKTMFQVPYGEGTMFFGKDGTMFKGITDGSSNTIALVQVAPTNAVEWTKPADWNVDFENPIKGLQLDRDQGTAIALGDSSAHVLRADVKGENLKQAVTRNGGEIVAGDELVK